MDNVIVFNIVAYLSLWIYWYCIMALSSLTFISFIINIDFYITWLSFWKFLFIRIPSFMCEIESLLVLIFLSYSYRLRQRSSPPSFEMHFTVFEWFPESSSPNIWPRPMIEHFTSNLDFLISGSLLMVLCPGQSGFRYLWKSKVFS